MCTVVYLRDLGLLSKNRDKSGTTEEEIVKTSTCLAVRTRGADYYSIGLNASGVAFASTAINPPEWTSLVEAGHVDQADQILTRHHRDCVRPTVLISRYLSEFQTAREALDCLQKEQSSWMGYNLVLADREKGYLVELAREQMNVQPLVAQQVVTNHFQTLKVGPVQPQDYPNSWDRWNHVNKNLATIRSLSDLQETIAPRDPKQSGTIWRQGAFATVSSVVLDLSRLQMHYKTTPGMNPRVYRIKNDS